MCVGSEELAVQLLESTEKKYRAARVDANGSRQSERGNG
jgi:hypothetical protein